VHDLFKGMATGLRFIHDSVGRRIPMRSPAVLACFLATCLGCSKPAGKDEPAPAPVEKQETDSPALAAAAVDLRIDGQGTMFFLDAKPALLPADAEAGEEARPAPGSLVDWSGLARALNAAGAAAPRLRPDPSMKDVPVLTGPKSKMACITLRLDPASGACSVQVGESPPAQGDAGFAKAEEETREALKRGANGVVLDAGADVPMSSWLRALRMARDAGAPIVTFLANLEPVEGSQKPRARWCWGADEKGKFFPDVVVRISVDPATPWKCCHAVMMRCCTMGIFKIGVVGKGGEFVKTYLPVDVDWARPEIEDERIPRDIFKEEAPPPIEEPIIVEEPDAGAGDDGEAEGPFAGKYAKGTGASGVYVGRFSHTRPIRFYGGGLHTERAVLAGLEWLKAHQNPDGTWSCGNFSANCKGGNCSGPGNVDALDTGLTGLALLAFLGAGHTTNNGKFQETVKAGLKALQGIQAPDGRFGRETADVYWIHDHAICTMAAAEAFELTGNKTAFRGMAQKAVDYLISRQHPGLGWGCGGKPGDSDSPGTAWAMLALHAARCARLKVPQECFDGALRWFDQVTDEAFRTGCSSKGDAGPRLPEAEGKFRPADTMTAAALLCRILVLGAAASNRPETAGGAELLLLNPPCWDVAAGTLDFYCWHFGTLAFFQVGGESWKRWNEAVKNALVPLQKTEGCEKGSWDPVDAWGAAGGRVWATAINTLTLESYYRYSRVLEKKK
jgi:hypothetical protein